MTSKKDGIVQLINSPRASQDMRPGANFLICYLVALGFSLTSFAALPENYPRTSSTAFQDYLETSVGQLFEAVAVQHPDKSGFAIIRRGRKAFTSRIALTEMAEKSLDVQYYIWEEDTTGRILAERLIRAADRGVRVARCLQ
jgi:putative cardiolipin synthase